MYRPFRMVVRFLALMLLLTAIAAVLGSYPSERSPYVSGLSDLTVGVATAARPNPCARTVCVTSESRICNTMIAHECKYKQGTCTTFECNEL